MTSGRTCSSCWLTVLGLSSASLTPSTECEPPSTEIALQGQTSLLWLHDCRPKLWTKSWIGLSRLSQKLSCSVKSHSFRKRWRFSLMRLRNRFQIWTRVREASGGLCWPPALEVAEAEGRGAGGILEGCHPRRPEALYQIKEDCFAQFRLFWSHCSVCCVELISGAHRNSMNRI